MMNMIVSARSGSQLLRNRSAVTTATRAASLAPTDTFAHRHIGPTEEEIEEMCKVVGVAGVEGLVHKAVPKQIRLTKPMTMEPARSETEALQHLSEMIEKNVLKKSFIGMGFNEVVTPGVILRNVLENPGWYTSYTPYQAEISQGRLEMLLNYQTMVADLTGLAMANASLLDEATAAAEAMSMCFALTKKRTKFFISDRCHPQNIALMQTRASAVGIELVIGDVHDFTIDDTFAGVMVSYPDTYGAVSGFENVVKSTHDAGALVVAATDLMSLASLEAPGTWGADIAIGSSQRFGVPMGFGGPHAGFMATSDAYARRMPGRIIGVTIDAQGKPALRMAMQTREQHIRRDKATSNICTAQALLANMAGAYGVYHGPQGLKDIASRIHALAAVTKIALDNAGVQTSKDRFFDTFTVSGVDSAKVQKAASDNGCNVRVIDAQSVGLSFGEAHTVADLVNLLKAFGVNTTAAALETSANNLGNDSFGDLTRTTEFMTHPIFNSYHSETQMMRYLKKLEHKDLALNHSMISLGSCTMKLNAVSEMKPVTWPKIGNMHPFAPAEQSLGYKAMIDDLNKDLATITGFAAVSSQPNSGANGEYAGLLAIKAWQEARGEGHRNICLIPQSAHGTNPASAAMCGMKIVVVKNEDNGDIDFEDLQAKVKKHGKDLAALMATYPSTYGVYEEKIVDICKLIHEHGGQVYMDGANMNAQVGLTSPGFIGADVCHLNLHKTFCIPHGGGGPGVGSIGVAKHLAPYLPGHSVVATGGEGDNVVAKLSGAVSAAPFGSASILPISYMYIKMLGAEGLTKATQLAILNANYMAKKLEKHYKILFRGSNGMCAHEFIMDMRPFKKIGVTEEDVCKRLQDYGFHGPTMSFPVAGTLMIEPTESEDKNELDRLVLALTLIREEIKDIEEGRMDYADSPLHHAPHTQQVVLGEWDRPYSREVAAFPAPWLKTHVTSKHWPTVSRIDNVYGDRNLICSCPPISTYETDLMA